MVFAFLFVANAHAALVILKDDPKPIIGFLVDRNDERIVIRQPLPTGERKHVILWSKIDKLLITVPPQRLAQLNYENPAEYRDLAEELNEKRKDPEARDAAIRLYLIAAYLAPDQLGRSSLLGLIDLARNDDEENKFRAMAYLLDPEHDAGVLRSPDLVKSKPTMVDDAARAKLVLALQLLRQGKGSGAKIEINRAGVKRQLDQFEEILSYRQFIEACQKDEISNSLLKAILTLELALSASAGDKSAVEIKRYNPLSWQESIDRDGRNAIPPLTLETITEFNPRECHFRDGKWVVPEEL